MPNKYYLLFLFILVVYAINLTVDVMAVDAAQYAEMSWEMLSTKSFLKVHCGGQDYLDKPPLLFWLNSLSFWLLGVSNVTYKLPSLLFVLLGVYATYRFALLYYSRTTATVAAVMLASSQAVFLITNDVRTDTILMGAVIFAIWQWAAFFQRGRFFHLIGGSVGVGLALLAKGPIGIIAVAAAIVPQLIREKKLKALIDIRLAVGLVLVLLMLLPMCIGLYEQWGVKGLRFYFWIQSFGRITGESQWSNNPDPLFLWHTTLWAFLPWSLFLFMGWGQRLITLFKTRFRLDTFQEIATLSGFTLVLIALTLSKYQLPHYAFIVYPLGAVMAADYFVTLRQHSIAERVLSVILLLICVLQVIATALLQYCLRGADPYVISLIIAVYILAAIAALRTDELLRPGKEASPIRSWRRFWLVAFISVAFNFLLSLFYFPSLILYQPENEMCKYIYKHRSEVDGYAILQYNSGYGGQFYARELPAIATWDTGKLIDFASHKRSLFVLSSSTGVKELTDAHVKFAIIDQKPSFPVAKLTLGFLNPTTRPATCETVYLLQITN